MADTNYIGSIVKILENPNQTILTILYNYKISSSITTS